MDSRVIPSEQPLATSKRDPSAIQIRVYERLLGTRLSRRQLFSLSLGTAAVAPLIGPLARAAARFRVDANSRSVRLSLSGVVLFEISAGLFDGRPRISCDHDENSLSIRVAGGYLPGTSVPADMEISALRNGLGWNGNFKIPGLNFDSSFPFEEWLLGHPVASGSLALSTLLDGSSLQTGAPGHTTGVHLYPSWTFVVKPGREIRFSTCTGAVQSQRTQLELVDSRSPALDMTTGGSPRTRLWFQGLLDSALPLRVDDGRLQLASGDVESVLEMQRENNVRRVATLLLENPATAAGSVAPGPPGDPAQTIPASCVKVATVNGDCVNATADVSGKSCWLQKNGAGIELTAVANDLRSQCNGGRGPFVVTRIAVPLQHVDHAMLVRRSRPSEGDDLPWLRGNDDVDILLDDFDLVLSRGADAFHVVLRFRNIVLRIEKGDLHLRPNELKPQLVEFSFGRQHVYEQALYVNEVPGFGASALLTDEAICALTGIDAGITCLTKMRDARASGSYQAIRNDAIHIMGTPPSQQPNPKIASARFSESSWFTFEWKKGRRSEQRLELDLETLFNWEARLIDGSPRFVARQHPNAKPADGMLDQQLQWKNNAPAQPANIATGTPSDDAGLASIIQAPYRLALAPIEDPQWKIRSVDPKSRSGLAEIWSLRAERLRMRAVWSPDFAAQDFWASTLKHLPKPFRGSLDSRDRHEIVALSSRFGEQALLGSANVVPKKNAAPQDTLGIFVPQPLDARLLLLSSYGATIRLKGQWAPPASGSDCGGALSVQLWDQNSQLGRDNKVVVEYKGFLFPLGHPATLVKETERRLIYDQNSGFIARLVQRYYIKIAELSRSTPLYQQPFSGRGWPFATVKMKSFISADLEDPASADVQLCYLNLGQQAFWPRAASIGGVQQDWIDFEFEDPVTGVNASVPLVFLDNSVVHSPHLLEKVVLHYRDELEQKRRGGASWDDAAHYAPVLPELDGGSPVPFVARVHDGKVRFAPENKPGNTSQSVVRFLLDVDIPHPSKDHDAAANLDCLSASGQQPGSSPCDSTPLALEESQVGSVRDALVIGVALETKNQPPFYPHLRQALVEAGTLSRVANTGRQFALVEIDGGYLRNGFDSGNPGEIYLRYANDKAALNFSADTGNSGGFANTTTSMSAVSRLRGPIGGRDPLPQLPVGYRYEIAQLGLAPAAWRQAAENQPDPVEKARQGIADPKEFFARALGNAKLCGVVSFVDIIDVVMKASGSRMPRILEELEHELPLDVIKEAAANLSKSLDDLVSGLSAAPHLAAAIADVLGTLARVETAAPADLLALGSQLVRECNRVRDELRTIIDNPATLLPTDTLSWINQVRELATAIRDVADAGSLRQIRDRLVVYVKAEALARAQAVLEADGRLPRLAHRIEDVRQAVEAITAALQNDPAALMQVIQAELSKVFESTLSLDVAFVWIDRAQADLEKLLNTYWQIVVKRLGDMFSDLSPGNIVSRAQALKTRVEDLARQVEIDLKTATAERAVLLNRAFLECADIGLSAVAHAAELERVLKEVGNQPLTPRIPQHQQVFGRVVHSLGTAQDSLAKATRLAEVLTAIAKDAPVDTKAFADFLRKEYGEWLKFTAKEFLSNVLNDFLDKLRNTTPPPNVKAAVDWVAVKTQYAAKQLSAVVPADLHVPQDLGAMHEILGFMVEIPDPQKIADRARREASLAAREQLLKGIALACDPLSAVAALVRDRLAPVIAAVQNSPDLKRWLPLSILTRFDALKILLDAAAQAPSESEEILRTYLQVTWRKLIADFSSLLADAGQIASPGNLKRLVDARKLVDAAIEQFGLPTRMNVTYDWDTEVRPYPGGAGPVFEPLDGKGKLAIKSRASVDLRGKERPTMALEATLDAFKINLFGSAYFLSVTFEPLKFTAATGQKSALKADVRYVDFGGQLSFIKTLQKWLKEKFGVTVEAWSEGPGIVVGYEYFRDQVTGTAFSLQNVGFNIACVLPFNSQPARFKFSLSRPDKPFLLSAGIYGGGGFVGIQSRADGIEYLECSFEYGLVTAFRFGPASGTGRITAGVYIRIGSRTAILSGFFNASGNADIAGLIRICANFRVQIWYDTKSGKASGAATFSISFSLGFLDFSFSVGVAYARQGDASTTQSEGQDRQAELRASILENQYGAYEVPGPVSRKGYGDIELRKQQQAARIATDKGTGDLSKSLLERDAWDRYWRAFEEPLDECA